MLASTDPHFLTSLQISSRIIIFFTLLIKFYSERKQILKRTLPFFKASPQVFAASIFYVFPPTHLAVMTDLSSNTFRRISDAASVKSSGPLLF